MQTTDTRASSAAHADAALAATMGQAIARRLAQRHAHRWQLIERALAAQQLTDDARAAVQRLHVQVERFAAVHPVGEHIAVLIEATPELIADFGGVAIHLGDHKFAFVGAQRDERSLEVHGDNGGNTHGGSSCEQNSVAQADLVSELHAAHRLLALALGCMTPAGQARFARQSEIIGLGTDGATRHHERAAVLRRAGVEL